MTQRYGRTTAERFWEKVQEGADGCWLWMAARGDHGYGNFRHVPGKTILAHRFAYEFMVGQIPAGLQLDHLCRNRACVNPAHLEPVTPQVNTIRGLTPISNRARAARQGACRQGHEFTPENTLIDARGWRKCRACRKAINARRSGGGA